MTSKGHGLKDWAEWLLFFSSYFPLYVIIAVKTRSISFDFIIYQTPVLTVQGYQISIISVILLVFTVIVVAFLWIVIKLKRGENGQPKPVKKPEERNELVVSYILIHVVPFAFIDYNNTLNILAFCLLFLSIGVIQVRSSYLYVNPILSLMKYDLYEIEKSDSQGRMLLAKTYEDANSDDSTVTAVELSNNVYITTR